MAQLAEGEAVSAERDLGIARAVRDWITAPRQTSGEAYRYWLSVHLDDDALARIIRTALEDGKIEPEYKGPVK